MKKWIGVSVVAVTMIGGGYFGVTKMLTKVHVAVQTEVPAVTTPRLSDQERRMLEEASGTVQQDAPQGRYLSFTNKSPSELFQNAESTAPSR